MPIAQHCVTLTATLAFVLCKQAVNSVWCLNLFTVIYCFNSFLLIILYF